MQNAGGAWKLAPAMGGGRVPAADQLRFPLGRY
jgi:hypothetical protein